MNPLCRAALFTLALSPACHAQPLFYTYEKTNQVLVLPTLGGDEGEALDADSYGRVVGWSRLWNGVPHGFLYDSGQITDVTAELGNRSAWAVSLNHFPEVVGYYDPLYPNTTVTRGFYWVAGQPLETLPSAQGMSHYRARAINEYSRIVGETFGQGPIPNTPDACFGTIPIKWLTPYDYLDPYSLFCVPDNNQLIVTDVNASLAVSGSDKAPQGPWQAWILKQGVKTIVPKPSPLACGMHAGRINDDDAIVGWATICHHGESHDRAFYWNGTSATSSLLPLLPGGSFSQASDVNLQNMVVGFAQMLVQGSPRGDVLRERAYLYHPHFGIVALPVPEGYSPVITNCRANALGRWLPDKVNMNVAGYCVHQGKKMAVRWNVTVGQTPYPPMPL